MSDEKPIRIRPHRENGHRCETRVFAREIHETWCVHKGCKFDGKPAAQGVCYSRLDRRDEGYLQRVYKRAHGLILEMRSIAQSQKFTAKQHIDYLERSLESNWMNAEFGLDELIRLRAENAQLKLAAGTYGTKKPRRRS